jgi:DNA-binding MarR family transcriptional regulator
MSDARLPIETIRQIRDECLCLAAQRAARKLARRFDRLFAPHGLTNGQFSMMVALSGEWKPRMGELAEFLAMDQTTMTAAAKTLEKRGLILLAADEGDGRVRRPHLTEDGRALVVQVAPLWREEHARLKGEMTEADPAALARGLRALG